MAVGPTQKSDSEKETTGDIIDIELSSSLKVGTIFSNRYRIEEQLGFGGMGCVYRAIDTKHDRQIALKVLHPSLLCDQRSRQRFIREGRALRSLRHRNVLSINDFAISSIGLLYLEMEYLDGRNLADIISKEGPLSISEFVSVFSQVLAALTSAHDQGIIHRDLKPSNIMLVKSASGADKVKIVDFGVAKLVQENDTASQELTALGEFIGSPSYMSPEQVEGLKVDLRSDIYSLGCVMYEAITGARAFVGKNALIIMHKQVKDSPLPFGKISDQDIPAWLERLVFKALTKNREKRYANCHAMRLDLLDAQFSTAKTDASAEHFKMLPWESLRAEESTTSYSNAESGAFSVSTGTITGGQITQKIKAAGTFSLGSHLQAKELRSFTGMVLSLLRKSEVVTDLELTAARQYQSEHGGDVSRILVKIDLLDQFVLMSAVKAQRLIELGQLTESKAILLIRDCQRRNVYLDQAVESHKRTS
ncbi:MAG: serine/threonine protein kinase [Candidatus Obscuribacterales bacterium]|nr:serine/threonine protein kinase [Candidatus Obscuribacterales bacterium]